LETNDTAQVGAEQREHGMHVSKRKDQILVTVPTALLLVRLLLILLRLIVTPLAISTSLYLRLLLLLLLILLRLVVASLLLTSCNMHATHSYSCKLHSECRAQIGGEQTAPRLTQGHRVCSTAVAAAAAAHSTVAAAATAVAATAHPTVAAAAHSAVAAATHPAVAAAAHSAVAAAAHTTVASCNHNVCVRPVCRRRQGVAGDTCERTAAATVECTASTVI
jgi:hypothetical protein